MVWDCTIPNTDPDPPHFGQIVNAGSFSPDFKTFLSAGQKGRQTLISWDVESMSVNGELGAATESEFVSRFASSVSSLLGHFALSWYNSSTFACPHTPAQLYICMHKCMVLLFSWP